MVTLIIVGIVYMFTLRGASDRNFIVSPNKSIPLYCYFCYFIWWSTLVPSRNLDDVFDYNHLAQISLRSRSRV